MLNQMQLSLGFYLVQLLLVHELREGVRPLGVEHHPEEFDRLKESLIPTINVLLSLLYSIRDSREYLPVDIHLSLKIPLED